MVPNPLLASKVNNPKIVFKPSASQHFSFSYSLNC